MLKGVPQAVDPQGAAYSVPMRGGGTDRPVVVMKPGNAGGAKGPDDPADGTGQPAMGGARA
jgi:hypothetical protein